MACFVESIVAAAVVAGVRGAAKRKENADCALQNASNSSVSNNLSASNGAKFSLSTKLGWLLIMFLGGSFLLAIEHYWHGEIIASFPFLSAIADGWEATSAMLWEIAVLGSIQVGVIIALWAALVWAAENTALGDMISSKAANVAKSTHSAL